MHLSGSLHMPDVACVGFLQVATPDLYNVNHACKYFEEHCKRVVSRT